MGVALMAEEKQSFFSSLGCSISPTGYKKLRYNGVAHGFVYVVILLLFGLLIKGVFLIPLTIDVLSSLENVSAKFEKANFEGVIETKEPVLIPIKRPLLQIDTSPSAARMGSVLITQRSIVFGDADNPATINFPDFSQSADSSELLSGILIGGLFILPSILLLLFLGGAVKCALLALLMGAIGFAIISSRGTPSGKANTFSLACYALTPMVLIESVVVPLRFGEFLFPIFSFAGITLYAVSVSLSLCLFFIWVLLSRGEKYTFG